MQTIDAVKWALDIALSCCGARAPIVGISGAQGSGKSWLARTAAESVPGAINLSLDDFYLPSAIRRARSGAAHPLFATRGVPGTHDIGHLNATLDALLNADAESQTKLPAFDKLRDEPLPPETWRTFHGRPSVIFLEGWCFGALPQSAKDLAAPVNTLERDEDRDGSWRRAVNAHLEGGYASLFARLDAILFLKAPSFEIVHAWRCQQEETALGRALSEAERQRIARFIAFFERITRSMLADGLRSDITLELDDARRVLATRENTL